MIHCSPLMAAGSISPRALVCIGVASALAAAYLSISRRRLRRVPNSNDARRRWDHGVEVLPSSIPGAGDGLFVWRDFEEGEVLGEYYGLVLSLLQAYQLENRDYLMGGFGLNAHVDARLALDAPGRYANDNFDKDRLNARFDKDKVHKRAKLVATRHIRKGEEVYVSYGDSYWRARGVDPESGKPVLPASADCSTESQPQPRGEN